MNTSLQLISALLKKGPDGFIVLSDRNITPKLLQGDASIALSHILSHVEKYKTIPSKEAIESSLNIELPEVSDSIEFLADTVVESSVKLKAMEILQNEIGNLQNSDPIKSMVKIEDAFREIRNTVVQKNNGAVSIYSLVPDVLAQYQKRKEGERGIPYPFLSINRASLGAMPGDLAVFVAKSGMGKTWMAILCALVAEQAGAKVLIATTEMGRVRMAERYLSMKQKLSYGKFRAGILDSFSEDSMIAAFKQLHEKDENRVQVVGGEFFFSPDNLKREIEIHQPHVTLVDGSYLLDMDGDDGREKAENIFNYLKTTAGITRTAIIANMQFNRNAKRDEPDTINSDNIGLTDRAAWNADLLYGMYQSKDMYLEKKMGFKAMKVREGSPEDFEAVWDISTMTFQELADPNKWDPFAHLYSKNQVSLEGPLF